MLRPIPAIINTSPSPFSMVAIGPHVSKISSTSSPVHTNLEDCLIYLTMSMDVFTLNPNKDSSKEAMPFLSDWDISFLLSVLPKLYDVSCVLSSKQSETLTKIMYKMHTNFDQINTTGLLDDPYKDRLKNMLDAKSFRSKVYQTRNVTPEAKYAGLSMIGLRKKWSTEETSMLNTVIREWRGYWYTCMEQHVKIAFISVNQTNLEKAIFLIDQMGFQCDDETVAYFSSLLEEPQTSVIHDEIDNRLVIELDCQNADLSSWLSSVIGMKRLYDE